MTCDLELMERRLRDLQNLQNRATVTDRSPGNPTDDKQSTLPGPALQKSMLLREPYSNSFSNKLRMSRERTRQGQSSNSAALLNRMQSRGSLPSVTEHAPGVGDDESTTNNGVGGVLLNLRNILDEQKKRHAIKRQRLLEIKEANAVAEKGLVVPESVRRSICSRSDDVSTLTNPTFFDSKESLDFFSVDWKDETVLTNKNENICFFPSDDTRGDASKFLKEDSSSSTASMDTASDDSFYSVSDENSRRSQSLAEMKARVVVLEEEKIAGDQTLRSFVAEQLRRQLEEEENSLVLDCQETECSEIKSLIEEQCEESDLLRSRISSLKKTRTVAKTVSLAMVLAIIVACAAFGLNPSIMSHGLYLSSSNIDWNAVCAPAKPGTKLTEETGPLEAPWWAPDGGYLVKAPLYQLAGCSDRPRTRVEIVRGMLRITTNNGQEELVKKQSTSAYLKAGSVHIMNNRFGGHVEIEAPWVSH